MSFCKNPAKAKMNLMKMGGKKVLYTWLETLWYTVSVKYFQWSHTDSECSHR